MSIHQQPPLQLRDTHGQKSRTRGASPAAKEPSAVAVFTGLMGQLIRAIPWPRVGLGAVVALAAGMMPWAIGEGVGLLDREFEAVHVEGDLHRLEHETLMGALEPLIGNSYFASDLNRVKEQVEMLPWVQSAAVGREWPGTLTVDVIEHHPVAFWNGRALVNREGEVFSPANSDVRGIPAFFGPEEKSQEVLEQARRFAADLEPHDLRLAQVALEERGAWTMQLDNGISVVLGRDRVEERFQRFLTVFENRLAPIAASVATVDARYGNGVSVSWRDSEIAAAGGSQTQDDGQDR